MLKEKICCYAENEGTSVTLKECQLPALISLTAKTIIKGAAARSDN
jgi:hypothetical protein